MAISIPTPARGSPSHDPAIIADVATSGEGGGKTTVTLSLRAHAEGRRVVGRPPAPIQRG